MINNDNNGRDVFLDGTGTRVSVQEPQSVDESNIPSFPLDLDLKIFRRSERKRTIEKTLSVNSGLLV